MISIPEGLEKNTIKVTKKMKSINSKLSNLESSYNFGFVTRYTKRTLIL